MHKPINLSCSPSITLVNHVIVLSVVAVVVRLLDHNDFIPMSAVVMISATMISCNCSDDILSPCWEVLDLAVLTMENGAIRVVCSDDAMGVAWAIRAVRHHALMLVHDSTVRVMQSSGMLMMAHPTNVTVVNIVRVARKNFVVRGPSYNDSVLHTLASGVACGVLVLNRVRALDPGRSPVDMSTVRRHHGVVSVMVLDMVLNMVLMVLDDVIFNPMVDDRTWVQAVATVAVNTVAMMTVVVCSRMTVEVCRMVWLVYNDDLGSHGLI